MNNLEFEPLVTIAIPSYNHSKYIQDSIKSAIQQTYKNIELIIIDDGSKDNSITKIQELITQCQDRFVRFEFRYRENKGLCNTLNEALEWSNGDYFCTLASDDMMLPEKTKLQLDAFLADSSAVSICGGFYSIDENNKIIQSNINAYREYTFYPIFMHRFNLPASSQMTKSHALKEVGGFNPNTTVEDWDLWLKLTKKYGKIIYIPYGLIHYRSHEDNLSKKLDVMFDALIKIIKNYKNEPNYELAVYRINKQYKVRPYQRKSPIKALILRLKYYIKYLFKR